MSQNVAQAEVAVKRDVTEAERQILQLTGKIDEAKSEVVERESEVVEREGKEGKVVEWEGKVVEAQRKVSEAERKVSEAERKVSEAQRKVSEAQRKVSEAQRKLGACREAVQSAVADLAKRNEADTQFALDSARDAYASANQYLSSCLKHHEMNVLLARDAIYSLVAAKKTRGELTDFMSALMSQLTIQEEDKVDELISISNRLSTPTKIDTPSKGDKCDRGEFSMLQPKCVHFERKEGPVYVGVPPEYANPFDDETIPELETLQHLLAESSFYGVASVIGPEWVHCERRGANVARGRSDLYAGTSGARRFLTFGEFQPELFTRVKNEETAAFNGEIKSAGSGSVMFHELAQYVLFAVIDSFFRQGNAGDTRHFFDHPPVGYGLMGMAHVGYIVSMELIGKAIITPCSQPFFMGSIEHQEAIQSLKTGKYRREVLDCTPKVFKQCDKKKERILFTKKAVNGKFWKVIRYDAFDASHFRNLYQVYDSYRTFDKKELKKHHLVPAELLFGELEVAVRMEFLDNTRECTMKDFGNIAIMQKVAKAVAFLGRRKLLYTDLRPPNVLIGRNDAVWLIDYDDIRFTENALTTADDFRRAFKELEEIPIPHINFMASGSHFSAFQQALEDIGWNLVPEKKSGGRSKEGGNAVGSLKGGGQRKSRRK